MAGMLVLAKSDLPAGVLNAAIGIGLALALWDHTSVELLLIAIVLACITSNRVYSRLYERRHGLEALHEFTKTVVRSIDMAQIASSVLGGARSLLNADDAVLLIETVAPGDPGRRFTLGAGGRGEECISVVELHGDLRAVIPDGTPRRFEVGPLSPAWLQARTSVAALAAPIAGQRLGVRCARGHPGPAQGGVPLRGQPRGCSETWPIRRPWPSRTACCSWSSSRRRRIGPTEASPRPR